MHNKHRTLLQRLIYTLLLLVTLCVDAHSQTLLRGTAERGDGIYAMLRRYNIPRIPKYIQWFEQNNAQKLSAGSSLVVGENYALPIRQYAYNGKSIRTTVGKNDYEWAKSIQKYNESMVAAGIKKKHYQADLDLWVPLYFFEDDTDAPEPVQDAPAAKASTGELTFSIFGEKYKSFSRIDQSLAGYYFYVVAGHGGPDPGAVGKRGNHRLCEDEYAYDITLRFARRLIEHGATVYVIVRDRNDGIRDTQILKPDWDEYYFGGARISSRTRTRLQKRADIINNYYHQNRNKAKAQYCVILHVDSRKNNQRIDIFYYYQQHSRTSKNLALNLYRTVRDKYAAVQPGRGYRSRVETRGLFMLQHTKPSTVYIELGNIQNTRDQDRFIIANNRQAVANWLTLGVQNYLK